MVWNEVMARWRTYSEAMGGPPPNAAPPQPGKAGPPVQPAYDPFADSKSQEKDAYAPFPQQGAMDSSGYTQPPKKEYYCAGCFKKFPASEMQASPNGMMCASCKDGSLHGVRTRSVADASSFGFEFTGTGGEYFRIWIVNMLLTVLTLGIYSAWAKVRKNRYFYRNTRLAGSSFDYHGNPVAILKGRILAALIIAAYYFSKQFNPTLYIVVVVLVAAIIPWMLTRAYAFRLYNTSWRGIRLRFHGGAASAYVVFVLYGCLTILTLGLCYPLFYRQIRMFMVNNAAFGTTRSELNISAGQVYTVFFKTMLIAFAIGIVLSIAMSLLAGYMGSLVFANRRQISPAMIAWIIIILMTVYMLYRVIVISFFRTRMTNLIWDNIRLGSIRFDSYQRARDLASIIAANALLTFLTLGFYWPWAKVQLARYYADTLLVSAPEGLNNFAADAEAAVSAAGDEISGALDVDFSF